MSRRSQVTQARRALENAPRPAAPPEQKQVTIDQFVPLLVKNGAPVSFLVQVDEPNKRIRFLATCGPIQIPVDVGPAKAREIAVGLLDVLDKIDPRPEAAEETLSIAEALAEAEMTMAALDPANDRQSTVPPIPIHDEPVPPLPIHHDDTRRKPSPIILPFAR